MLFNFVPRDVKYRVKRSVKAFVKLLLKIVSAFLPNPGNYPHASEVSQVVLFGDMGIGNFVMFTPIFGCLRDLYPRAEIVVVFFADRGASLVASQIKDIDRVIHIPNVTNKKLIDVLIFLLNHKKHKLLPQILIGRFNGSAYLPLFLLWLKPAFRVGHVSSAGFSRYFDVLFNYPVQMNKDEHEVTRNINLVRKLGLSINENEVKVYFPLIEADISGAKTVMSRYHLESGGFICLQVGSSEIQKWKRWPAESWERLISKIQKYNMSLVILGDSEERKIGDEIISKCSLKPINLCGELSLGVSAAVIKMSRLLICNDSGLMHIAAAVDTPIIGLFGPTEYERSRPWTNNFVGLRGNCVCNVDTLFSELTIERIRRCQGRCLNEITADLVETEVVKLLFKQPA